MPALPFRMTSRMVRELALFRTDSRARRLAQRWTVLAGRYRTRIQQSLAAEGMPTALLWVAAAESAFDPRAESSAGAAGLWQFMPDTARSFGLRVDSWVDERRDPEHSTRAAVRYLRDLHARLGSWELAFAAYNMGYTNLLRSIRKYNTNDFDTLATLEAGLPWETTHYVPRILSLAVAAQNPGVFEITTNPPGSPGDLGGRRGAALAPALRHRPRGAGVRVDAARAQPRPPAQPHAPAERRRRPSCCTSRGRGANGAHRPSRASRRPPRAPTCCAMGRPSTRWPRASAPGPRRCSASPGSATTAGWAGHPAAGARPRPVTERAAAAPEVPFDAALAAMTPPEGAPGVAAGDLPGHACRRGPRATGAPDDLARWNNLDRHARVHGEMWLQAFVSRAPDDTARTWSDAEVALDDRASDAFHDRSVTAAGQVRLRVTAAPTTPSPASRRATAPPPRAWSASTAGGSETRSRPGRPSWSTPTRRAPRADAPPRCRHRRPARAAGRRPARGAADPSGGEGAVRPDAPDARPPWPRSPTTASSPTPLAPRCSASPSSTQRGRWEEAGRYLDLAGRPASDGR
jgi:membrane-bound lytic murein transglycosylase D